MGGQKAPDLEKLAETRPDEDQQKTPEIETAEEANAASTE